MKAIYSFLTAFLFCCLIAGCSTDMDQVQTPAEPEYFIEVLRRDTADLEDFIVNFDFGEQFAYLAPILRNVVKDDPILVYVISYRTQDPFGNPVTASGTVYVPDTKNIRGVIEVAPIAYIQNTMGASERTPALEAMQSCFGYISILPDFLGYGISKDKMPHPLLQVENNGLVAYHMRQASREFLQLERNYKLPDKTIVAGYSLGASLALATARYYQLHGENVHIDLAAIGCGCYDPVTAFNAFIECGTSDYPLIPSIITSLDYYYNLNLDYSKIFTGPLLDNYASWLDHSANHGAGFLSGKIGNNIHNYLHPDFFTEEKNPEILRLYEVLKANSHVDGWVPEFPLYIYHATDDRAVPYACAEYAYEQFKAGGAHKVELRSNPGGHVGFADELFINLYLYLLIK